MAWTWGNGRGREEIEDGAWKVAMTREVVMEKREVASRLKSGEGHWREEEAYL